jgi:endoglucanase
MKTIPIFFSIISIFSIIFTACSTGPDSWVDWPAYEGEPAGPAAFIRTNGAGLVTPEGEPYLVKGVSFGNHVWGNPSTINGFTHHGPEDYPRAKFMGFNSIRFCINYGLFEDDVRPYSYKKDGFTWLNKNIASARFAGIRLILNLHYPQGGFQSNGDGDALWTNRKNQLRLIALWKEIARRYKDEEYILGYGLVNEPVPLTDVAQWTSLAQEIIDAIRIEDPHHLLFVERANWLKGGAIPRQIGTTIIYQSAS